MTDLEMADLELMTPREIVARIKHAYGWSATVYSVYKWIQRGLPARKIVGRYGIRWVDFEAWLESGK
jgi:hypothetical protein